MSSKVHSPTHSPPTPTSPSSPESPPSPQPSRPPPPPPPSVHFAPVSDEDDDGEPAPGAHGNSDNSNNNNDDEDDDEEGNDSDDSQPPQSTPSVAASTSSASSGHDSGASLAQQGSRPNMPPMLRRRLSSFVRFHREVSKIEADANQQQQQQQQQQPSSASISPDASHPLIKQLSFRLLAQRHRNQGQQQQQQQQQQPGDEADSRWQTHHHHHHHHSHRTNGIEKPHRRRSILVPPSTCATPLDAAAAQQGPPQADLQPQLESSASAPAMVYSEAAEPGRSILDEDEEKAFQLERYMHGLFNIRVVYMVSIVLRFALQFFYYHFLSDTVELFSMVMYDLTVFVPLFAVLVFTYWPNVHFKMHGLSGSLIAVVYAFTSILETRLIIDQLMAINKPQVVLRYCHPDRALFLLLYDLCQITFLSLPPVPSIISAAIVFSTVTAWWWWLAVVPQMIDFVEMCVYTAWASVALLIFLSYVVNQETSQRADFTQQLQLKHANCLLEAEVEKLREAISPPVSANTVTMTAPIEQVTEMLKTISSDPLATCAQVDVVNRAIDLLTTDQLFAPRLGSTNTLDTDTMTWLKSEVHLAEADNHQRPKKIPRSKTHIAAERSPTGSRRSSHPDVPPIFVGPDITAMLHTFTNWDFDLFTLRDISQGSLLKNLFLTIAYEHHLIDELNLDVAKLSMLLVAVENGYNADVIYHNSLHAADVLQTLHNLMMEPALLERLSAVEKFAIFFAAACHDLHHPGFTNSFLVKTKSQLALLYNDQSVLENHHLAETFRYLFTPELNVLAHLPQTDQETARRIIIDLVLATDMAKHFTLLSNFNAKVSAGNLGFSWSEDLTLVFQMLMKCADVSNAGKPLPIYLKWVKLISEEFFRQGDEEKRRSMPVTPFMDREKPRMATNQVNFLQYICLPIFKPVAEQLDRPHILQHAYENLDYFKKRQQAGEERWVDDDRGGGQDG